MMIPGRVLVIDDKRGEVDDLVDEFLARGEHAIYSDIVVQSEYCSNVRLLIMDYFLVEYSEKDSLDTITTIIDTVSEKTNFFMVIIWSAKVTEENREEFKTRILERYQSRFKKDMPGILLQPISKDELNYQELINRIEIEIDNFPNLSLIYEMERILNSAKDKALNRICDIGNWSNLIKTLKKEYTLESIMRQILSIYLTMLKRNLISTDKYGICIARMFKTAEPFSVDDFARIYSSQYYYSVLKGEQIGTGDVLFSEKNDKYYMIITPECDITNDKHTSTKLIEAIRIDHPKLVDLEYLKGLIKEIPAFIKCSEKKIIDAIPQRGRGLSENYHILPFLRDYEKKEFFHLLFDFHKIKSLRKTRKLYELQNYTRICRVDVPLINDFIQRYVSYSSRFGTMTIPDEVSKSLKSELKPNQEPPSQST